MGAEAGVKGPVAAHPPALRAGTPEVCAPPCATLSLAPPADAAKYPADLGTGTLAEKGVRPPLLSDRRGRTVPAVDDDVIGQSQELVPDPVEEPGAVGILEI